MVRFQGVFLRDRAVNQRSGESRYLLIQREPADGQFYFHTSLSILVVQFLLEASLQGILNDFVSRFQLQGVDQVQVLITDGRLTVSRPLIDLNLVNVRDVFNLIVSTVNSAQVLDLFSLSIILRFVRAPRGGHYFRGSLSVEEFLKKKQAIIIVENTTFSCFYQCLALGLAQLDSPDMYQLMIRGGKHRKNRYREIGSGDIYPRTLGQEFIAVNQMWQFEQQYQVQINILDLRSLRFRRISKGDRMLYFLFVSDLDNAADGHYHYINRDKVGSLWNHSKFCVICMKGYQDIRHKCIEKCRACRRDTCLGIGQPMNDFFVVCDQCNLRFYDLDCFEAHRKTCGKYEKICNSCNLYYRPLKNIAHRCGHLYCRNCETHFRMDARHECFVQPVKEVKEDPKGMIVWDLESAFTPDTFEHCLSFIAALEISDEGEEMKTFDDMPSFMDWVLQKRHKDYVVIAHNAARYDTHFAKIELLRRNIKTKDIVQGCTLFSCHVRSLNIRFMDSFRFIPIALRKFPKTFGFADVVKGYFPYRFYTVANQHYFGSIPPMEAFDFECLPEAEYPKAVEWYKQHENDIIDLHEVMKEYCMDDVRVLARGVKAYVKLFKQLTGIHPFNYVTIASLCLEIYRHHFMPLNTIGILNENPFVEMDIIDDWLRDTPFSARRDPNNKFVFERCIDVGCEKCFRSYTYHPTNFQPMRELRLLHKKRLNQYVAEGLNVVTQKECEFRQIESLGLTLRDAFFGGRTEPFKLYYKCRGNEKIRYYDYTSLYPFVQSCRGRGISSRTQHLWREWYFPVGHPIYIREGFRDLSEYFGFAKVRVATPKELYIPVLPVRTNGKLRFALNQEGGNILEGTWTTIEILEALDHGYELLHIYEVCHFPEKSKTLFRKYMDMFFRVKEQAKGWEKIGVPYEERDRYIAEYEEKTGIRLRAHEMGEEFNSGLYFIAKLCLNSLWGKLGQRDNYTSSEDVFNEEDLESLVFSDSLDIVNVTFHNPTTRTVTYRPKIGFKDMAKNTNIAIAAYVTAYARLRLYEALDLIGTNMLYCDTDSVIFIDDGDVDIVTGSLLGDLTNELGTDEWITEFVSTGPKSYAYKTNLGNEACKVKGICLNMTNSTKLNFDEMKNILDGVKEEIIVGALQFQIREDHSILLKDQGNATKRFRLTFDKRQVVLYDGDDHCIETIPH